MAGDEGWGKRAGAKAAAMDGLRGTKALPATEPKARRYLRDPRRPANPWQLLGGEGQVNEVHVVSSNTISRLITNSGTTQLDVEHMAAIINQALPPA